MYNRKESFDLISKGLTLLRYDIEHHQSISDYSLNIHGENFFRDIFNFIYKANFQNCNFFEKNFESIDLIDQTTKKAYQITTTRTKEKIEKSIKLIKDNNYKDYEIKIFYLIEKAKPNTDTVNYFKSAYNITITEKLKDITDLIQDINNLEDSEIINLCNSYFINLQKKYTDEITINLVIHHIVKEHKTIKKDYDDTFGTVESKRKIKLNSINDRIASKINDGIDYANIIENIYDYENTITDLRELVINNYYKNIIIEELRTFTADRLINFNLEQLHQLAVVHTIDFNKIIKKLSERLHNEFEIKDFNTISVNWIIISYFFEICDIGIHQ